MPWSDDYWTAGFNSIGHCLTGQVASFPDEGDPIQIGNLLDHVAGAIESATADGTCGSDVIDKQIQRAGRSSLNPA